METRGKHPHGKRRQRRSGLFLVLRDVILLIVVMNVFALFHHVIPVKMTPVSETAAYQAATSRPEKSSSPAPAEAVSPTPQ